MAQASAGLLMCRRKNEELEFFLVHPGGPFFQKKNEGWWTIPKGIANASEELFETAKREFFEETGIRPTPPFHELGFIKQKSGKTVYAWAFSGGWEPAQGILCNEFTIEWPPRSGIFKNFAEVDKAAWMNLTEAKKMINSAQSPFLDRAMEIYKQPTLLT